MVQRRNGGDELFAGLQRVDVREAGLDRLEAGGVDRRSVHAGLEVVAHLLLHGRAVGSLGVGLEDAPEKLLVFIRELRVDAPRCLVRGDGIVLHPATAGELVEVDAGIDTLVHAVEIERWRVRHLLQRLHRGRGHALLR